MWLTDSVSKTRPGAKSVHSCSDKVTSAASLQYTIQSLYMNHPDDLNHLSWPSARRLNKFSYLKKIQNYASWIHAVCKRTAFLKSTHEPHLSPSCFCAVEAHIYRKQRPKCVTDVCQQSSSQSVSPVRSQTIHLVSALRSCIQEQHTFQCGTRRTVTAILEPVFKSDTICDSEY